MKKRNKRRLIMLLCICFAMTSLVYAGSWNVENYDNFPDVPDYGELAGVEPMSEEHQRNGDYYNYPERTTADLHDYWDALEDAGFELLYEEYNDIGISYYMNIQKNQRVIIYDYITSLTIFIPDSSYKNENIFVKTKNVKLKAGEKKYSLDIQALNDGNIRYYCDNVDAVDCEWEEGWRGDNCYLYLTPKDAGTAHIVITDDDTKEAVIVNVIVSGGTKKVTKKLASCTTYVAKPKLGSGSWKTSDSSIVSLSCKTGSTCTFRLKKAGTAKVTFKSEKGTYIYTIKVYRKKSDPLRAGYIEMNSANGIEPGICIVNNSSKRIKYVNFKATFYNAVGDKVYNEIGYDSIARLKVTGPISAWSAETYYWQPVFYNSTVSRMYVKSATVTYMDGSKKTFSVKKSFNYNSKEFDKYW